MIASREIKTKNPIPLLLLVVVVVIITIYLFSMHINAKQWDFKQMRNNMIAEIEQDLRLTQYSHGLPSFSPMLINALNNVPRHEFVPENMIKQAYDNHPLPIGHGQTISQPFIVALMTELLNLTDQSTVLEIGTGSGYQAAILGQMAKHVYTIEIIEPLAQQAIQLFNKLGYRNIFVRAGDGYQGWPEHAPYDAIIVTAAPEKIPPQLSEQLKPGGKIVIPVGAQYQSQQLLLIEKDNNGKLHETTILPVSFVPFTRH